MESECIALLLRLINKITANKNRKQNQGFNYTYDEYLIFFKWEFDFYKGIAIVFRFYFYLEQAVLPKGDFWLVKSSILNLLFAYSAYRIRPERRILGFLGG